MASARHRIWSCFSELSCRIGGMTELGGSRRKSLAAAIVDVAALYSFAHTGNTIMVSAKPNTNCLNRIIISRRGRGHHCHNLVQAVPHSCVICRPADWALPSLMRGSPLYWRSHVSLKRMDCEPPVPSILSWDSTLPETVCQQFYQHHSR